MMYWLGCHYQNHIRQVVGMSNYTKKCIRCGIFNQSHNGEYPSLCKNCADYMKSRRMNRWETKAGGKNDN